MKRIKDDPKSVEATRLANAIFDTDNPRELANLAVDLAYLVKNTPWSEPAETK